MEVGGLMTYSTMEEVGRVISFVLISPALFGVPQKAHSYVPFSDNYKKRKELVMHKEGV